MTAVLTRPAEAGRVAPAGKRRRKWVGWAFAAPFTVLFLVFALLPVIASLVMSVTDMRATDLRTPLSVNFVGLDNYTRLFSDDLFVRSAINTLVFVGLGVPLTIVAAMAAANGLNSGLIRFRALFRVGFYLPVVTSIVAIAVIWRFLLDPEAGQIDGAGPWQRFRYLILPLLRPTVLFTSVTTGIGYLQFFEEPLVMTQGGPLNSTLSVSMYTYQQFGFGNYGLATSMAYLLFVVIAVITFIQFRLLREK